VSENRRGLEVGLVAAAAVAVIGLISGVEGSGRALAKPTTAPTVPTVAVDARSYRDMRTRAYGPNAALPAVWFRTLHAIAPDPFAVVSQTPADRDAALLRRASRRVFDGAPPTIPHAIDQLATPACLSCHGEGVMVAGMTAPVMSHVRRDSCVQCHVVAADPRPLATTPPAPPTSFVGTESPRGGARAWQGAPPTIPHSTWMREQCASCHGPKGTLGMRTPHPWQQSCTQCHAPSATLDQRAPTVGGAAP
jgi:cytochrome c-type protein NapB